MTVHDLAEAIWNMTDMTWGEALRTAREDMAAVARGEADPWWVDPWGEED